MDLKSHLSLTLLLVGGCLAIAGALITYGSLKQLKYQSIEGKIIESGVHKRSGDISSSSTRTYSWEFWATYEYWVDGEHHQSDKVASQPPSSNAGNARGPSEELKNLVKLYAPGNTVTVFVSPDNPKKSVLIRSDKIRFWLLLCGALIAVLGIFVRFR